jgi:hypothetical protein
LNRATEPSTQPPLFATRRANRFGFAAQIVFAFWLLGMNGYGSWVNWFEYGGGQPKSPLYDIWEVDQQSATPNSITIGIGRTLKVNSSEPSN